MELKYLEEKKKISLFCNVGIVVLSVLLVVFLGMHYVPKAIPTNGKSNIKPPISYVDCTEQKVSLSFDTANGTSNIRTILDILEKHNVKATFFMTGDWIKKYPEYVKNIAIAGHDLGNHSENHKQMSKLTKEQCMNEIMKPHKRVKDLTGIEMELFRAPYRDYNHALIETITECNYYPVEWQVDSLDWKEYGVEAIIHSVCNNKELRAGSVIACHSGAKYIKEALDTLITTLQEKEYELVPISQLIYREDYEIDEEGRQFLK